MSKCTHECDDAMEQIAAGMRRVLVAQPELPRPQSVQQLVAFFFAHMHDAYVIRPDGARASVEEMVALAEQHLPDLLEKLEERELLTMRMLRLLDAVEQPRERGSIFKFLRVPKPIDVIK